MPRLKRADKLIFELIAERRSGRRGGDTEGDDVLAMLLAARHDGRLSAMMPSRSCATS